ncbi:hypothetical protein HH214_19680 [Mucilaginibacter robiniae]|uniref:Uncharacterized protein n=1 Tax=Mucilaginibacter robiniae TaxID=2728022 RepID=A0A7L5E6H1_9SPHI|nr:hypothetical protein [Mucilaginibacter robiniae]QJD97939.1 hypothetical protein HH214_19680 [Mucilaginibacter robiniae]
MQTPKKNTSKATSSKSGDAKKPALKPAETKPKKSFDDDDDFGAPLDDLDYDSLSRYDDDDDY